MGLELVVGVGLMGLMCCCVGEVECVLGGVLWVMVSVSIMISEIGSKILSKWGKRWEGEWVGLCMWKMIV